MSALKQTPWHYTVQGTDTYDRQFGTIYSGGDSYDDMVAESIYTEDAEYIVRAVNSHAELLAALEEMMALRDAGLRSEITAKHELEIVRDARAAIAKAKGEA